MSQSAPSSENSLPLRLWPGIAAVALQCFGRYLLPLFMPEAMPIGAMGGLLFGLLILVWWAFFSRAPRSERVFGSLVFIGALGLTFPLLHPSMATGGMGLLFPIYATPLLCLGFVAWAAIGTKLAAGLRRPALIAVAVLACGGFTLIRTAGLNANAESDFQWRWAPTPEDLLMAQGATAPKGLADKSAERGAEWPGFRGAQRDGRARGVSIQTDWSKTPPQQLWRKAIGPGWSSFAVRGQLIYTQEQRGEEELVSCYDARSGEAIWRHRDATRFWESNAGAGPRGTPTLHGDRVYSFGATGIVNALDARTGKLAWSRNAAEDTGAEQPEWGFSSSPLVTDDLVYVAASGTLAAYDRESGELRWKGPTGGESYSSPHRIVVDGVAQIVLISKVGADAFDPLSGKALWSHAWPGFPVVQPALTADGDLLLNAGGQTGLRRLALAKGDGGWTLEERWTSRKLRPNFNDYVIHQGHAYGLQAGEVTCIELGEGKRKWIDGEYGSGQLMLVADQSLLVVLSEEGELALVKATPEAFEELGRFQAIDGKTWNHPVLVGDMLLVRNDKEMAAYRVTPAEG